MSKYVLKFLCIFLCVSFILPWQTSAMTLNEAQKAQEEVLKKINNIKKELEEISGDLNEKQQYQLLLQEKIDILETSIDESTKSIAALSSTIIELEHKIQDTANEYSETFQLLKERIKALYIYGNVSTLEFLLDASSLYELSLRSVAMEAIADYDKQLLEALDTYLALTQDDRDELTKQKGYIAELKKQQELDKIELDKTVAENLVVIEEMQADETGLYQDLTTYNAEDDKLNKLIKDLIAEQEEADNSSSSSGSSGSSGGSSSGSSSSGSASSGDLVSGLSAIWPVPGYTTITCLFGNGHYGLDIGAPYGVPVVAVQSGKVLSAEYHWSWGYNVLVYHNSTYSTRYAHFSTMAVSAGEYVHTGQVVGYIGSTGNSTGNHLHFEVYKNGSRVNPYPYLF